MSKSNSPSGVSWASTSTVSHDSKAVYQRYIGWYDSNPANLWPLPPTEAGKKYVEFMGGADAVIKKAKQSFDDGDYRFVAEVMKHVVFGDPSNKAARELQADAFEQLGYQTENPTWRNEYLMGAYELRNGVPKVPGIQTVSPDMVASMSPELLLDFMRIRLNGPNAAKEDIKFVWRQPDAEDTYLIELKNGVIIYTTRKTRPSKTRAAPRRRGPGTQGRPPRRNVASASATAPARSANTSRTNAAAEKRKSCAERLTIKLTAQNKGNEELGISSFSSLPSVKFLSPNGRPHPRAPRHSETPQRQGA